MSGKAVAIRRYFHRERTACICRIIRPIHRSIVHYMRAVPRVSGENSGCRKVVRDTANSMRIFTRNICIWQDVTIPCSDWMRNL